MSEIDIRRGHSLTLPKAREAAEKVARQLKQEFALQYRWEGTSLHFTRAGVDGKLMVNTSEVHLRAKLGLLLAFLKPQIERKVHEHLEARDDQARSLTYTIPEGVPFPVTGYRATMVVSDDGGRGRLSWTCQFEPDGVSEAEASGAIQQMYGVMIGWISDLIARES